MVERSCICGVIPTVVTRTRIVIVRHIREVVKPSGTARIAELALASCEVIDYRDEEGELPPWLRDPALRIVPKEILSPSAVAARLDHETSPHLLFPTGRTSTTSPSALVILDGTWRQVRAMYQRIPGCARMPTMSLDAAPSVSVRLRNAIKPGQRSTLEAIADAISALEGPEVAAPLHELHARFVHDSLRSRGRMRPA